MKKILVLHFARLTSLSLLISAFPACISLAQQRQPFTHSEFNDDSSKLQFSIISDLWGGYRPGVFKDAVEKLNLMQPQFVMSVGDLIDGKTYDSVVLDKQWKEFNISANALSMPFFYVPGNHDISNPYMDMEWNRRFGKSYYYFTRKNVLFICINTQDGGSSGIGEEQVAYFKKAIKDHPDVRWTFVFMHRPVWQGEDGTRGGYEKIETALAGSNYTLFSGHHHTYLKLEKKGNNHYVLGSTGGGSSLRGEEFGEFDHITWVTLNETGPPKIINIKLDGMIRDDIVNKETLPITNTLTDGLWLTAPTHVSQERYTESVKPVVIFNNPTDYLLTISGELSNLKDYSVQPQRLDLTIPPQTNKCQLLTIKSKSNSIIDLSLMPFIEIELSGSYKYGAIVYKIPTRKKLFLEWKYILPGIPKAEQTMNSILENKDTTDFTCLRNPGYLENSSSWHGPEDCLISFRLAHDKRYVYLVAFIDDDQIVTGEGKERDLLYIDFENKNDEWSHLTIYPDPLKSTVNIYAQTGLMVEDIQLSGIVEGENLIKIMLKVPINQITKADGSLRFNIGYHDQDNIPVTENSTLYWKPLWGSETDYQYSGSFVLKNQD